jgi:hypothetical protein
MDNYLINPTILQAYEPINHLMDGLISDLIAWLINNPLVNGLIMIDPLINLTRLNSFRKIIYDLIICL